MLSCEIFENFKNTYFEEHLRTTSVECLQRISLLLVLGKPMLDDKRHKWATNTLSCKHEPHEVCAMFLLYQNAFGYFFQASEEGKRFRYWCKSSKHKHDKVEEFCNLINLSNLIKSVICFTKTHSSKIDLILTSNSNSIEKSDITETGSSHLPKLISTFFKSHISKLGTKAIYIQKLQKLWWIKIYGRFN